MRQLILKIIALSLLFFVCENAFAQKSPDSLLNMLAEDWQGTPYRYGGSSKSGIDCSGLACFIYDSVFHMPLPRSSGNMFANSVKLHPAQWSYGDLVFFEIRKGRVSHVGIYLCEGYFLHASTSKGVRVDHLSQRYYKKRVVAIGRPEKRIFPD